MHWPFDVHTSISVAAAVTSTVGLLFAFDAFTVVATYCMIMYAVYPTLIVHEVMCLLVAGFVFQQPLSTVAMCIYAVAYLLFLVAIPLPRLPQKLAALTPSTSSAPAEIHVDDI